MKMVKLLTMDMILILLANLLALAVIFLIAVYCWLDKKRFHAERQFRAVKPLFDEWINQASRIPSCGEAVLAYQKTKNISAKYRALSLAAQSSWGRETPAMLHLAEELQVFLGVYHALAEDYNRKLNSRFTGKIAAFLGFIKLPYIQLETTNVQN